VGFQALAFTRYPRRLRDLAPASELRIVRLGGHEPLGAESALEDPTPTSLSGPMREFLRAAGENGLLYLDAVEYLSSRVEWGQVLQFVQWLGDEVRDRGGALVVSANPGAFEKRQRQLLEGEFDRTDPSSRDVEIPR
jgi:hypothetical protein